MRRLASCLLLIALSLLTSGCAHYVWVRADGGNPATYPQDNYACLQDASAQAPPVYQTYVPYPPYADYDRVETRCVMVGHVERCRINTTIRPGFPPQPVTTDLNEPQRNALFNACMNARGWLLQAVEERD